MKCSILPSNKFHKPKASVKKKKKTMAESRATWILTAFAVLTFTVVSAVDDKCAACYAVADELERGLSNEKPRNHLDMRNRLNSKGQREGKLIDYRVSDLRVVELLDGLCDKMQDYTLQKVDSSRSAWVKVDNWDKLTANKQEARAHSKAMSSYCGRLLEETEDELADLIKKGSVNVGGVSKVLCQDLSKHCKSSVTHRENDSTDDDSDKDSDEDSDDESDGEL